MYDAWRPGGLANAVEGVSRPQVLARLLAGYDRFYPRVQNPEGRSIADHADDPTTPIDDRWGELTLPILYFAEAEKLSRLGLEGIRVLLDFRAEFGPSVCIREIVEHADGAS